MSFSDTGYILLTYVFLLSVVTVNSGIDAIKHGWAEYLQQPVLPASIAYVFLYFNIVLTPGGLMTAFLTQRGMAWLHKRQLFLYTIRI